MQTSYCDYEMSILYYNQTMGERYELGQEATLYHDREQWSKRIKITSGNGNIIEAEVVEQIATIVNVADDGTKTVYSCEFLGQYTNLYRVAFDDYDLLDGSIVLHLPNGENYPVRLRWKDSNEICFQTMGRKKL